MNPVYLLDISFKTCVLIFGLRLPVFSVLVLESLVAVVYEPPLALEKVCVVETFEIFPPLVTAVRLSTIVLRLRNVAEFW